MIPKTLKGNLEWRQRILGEARMSTDFQAELRGACAASPWFWINCFAWTYRPKYVAPTGETVQAVGHEAHLPFVTWLIQDEFIGELCDAIRVATDVQIDKSRDMGASWLCLAVIHWHWQFKASMSFMELSRKEEYVDRKGEMDTLFEKHRYLLKHQPAWLRPRKIKDNYMLLGNLDLGSTIIGESTNGDAGRGGRKHAILLDEFAAVTNGAEVCAATADTAGCRIFNSTPGGPDTEFFKIKEQKRAKLLTLPWWTHPEKGRGAYQVYDDRGTPKWVSPWYLQQLSRRSKKEVAQELDMDHGKAGDNFFDVDELERHRRSHVVPPVVCGAIKWVDDFGDDAKAKLVRRSNTAGVRFVRGVDNSPWRIWIPLEHGRPNQDARYVFGIDIANGSGHSNSVISVADDLIGQKVAEFASPHVSPEELAEIACAAAIWFGGEFGPFMAWENNGPGGIFGRKVIKLGWPHVYYQRQLGTKHEVASERYGWNSNDKSKVIIVGAYREAIEKDRLVIPNAESLDEARDYITDEHGALVPGKLKQESNGARATHGDRVIADAVMQMAREELPAIREREERAPEGSPAWRRNERIRRDRASEWDNE